jgi:hypothetical protein
VPAVEELVSLLIGKNTPCGVDASQGSGCKKARWMTVAPEKKIDDERHADASSSQRYLCMHSSLAWESRPSIDGMSDA